MFETAINILNIIENRGYKAYIVGGYIRDKLLNIDSNDIDLCTNATPEQLASIFSDNITLNNYGSCRLLFNGYNYEITTFREDNTYIKNRKPSSVSYVNTIEKDVLRRDFTINSLYMDKDKNIIDLLDAKEDINNRIIKSIGDPYMRLEEDSLRILRAIRFSCVLNFNIDKELEKAIISKKHLIKNISHQRKKEELEKIYNSDNYKLGFYLINKYNMCDELGFTFNNIKKAKNIIGLWAQLDFKEDYEFSKIDKNKINNVKEIINYGKIDEYILSKYSQEEIIISSEIINEG